jgi:HEAT repeat protein
MRRPLRARILLAGLVAFLAAGALAAGTTPAAAQDSAFTDVVARLGSSDPAIRMDALRQLRDAGYLQAAPAIAPLLGDADPQVQALAVQAVVSLFLVDESYTRAYGKAVILEQGATLPLLAFVQRAGATIANPAPPAIIRGLIAAARSPAMRTRFDAAYALGVLGPPLITVGQFPDGKAAADALLTILREPDATMRLAATHVLGRLMGAALRNEDRNTELTSRRTEVGDQIVAGMNDPDVMIRLSSMGALGEMRYDRAVQSLTDTYGYYKKGPEAIAALDAVARIGHPGSLPVFIAQLGHREAFVRRLAVEGIARTGDKDGFAEMEVRTSRDQSAFVTYARAFARATVRDYSQLTKLVEGFKYSLLQSEIFDYLVELGAPLASELWTFSTHKDVKVRAGVAEVLGIVGSQASLPAVEALMGDKNSLVAAAAARSQKRLVPRDPAQPRVS